MGMKADVLRSILGIAAMLLLATWAGQWGWRACCGIVGGLIWLELTLQGMTDARIRRSH
jgi:hypothetical protein